MFERKIKLFKLMGFEVGIDPSWVVIAILIAWSLSTGWFPFQYKNLSTQTYWIMGIVGALGLFLSIIVHEFSHSLAARTFGLEMTGITLFIFGGVAEMKDEPPSPKAEFIMAVMGPVASIVMGLIFYGLRFFGQGQGLSTPVNGVLGYLAYINLILAGFNIVPAFPLDGGRVLRAILWGIKGNLRWATRVTSQIGSGFGILLIFLGILSFFQGNFIGGMWWFLIGLFIRGAAKASYQQLLTRRALEGESVSRFMKSDPVTVNPSITLQELVDDYVYKYHFKMFPVVSNGNSLSGCITTRQVKDVPREEWDKKTVGDIADDCSSENTIDKNADAMEALSAMNRNGNSRLMVVDQGRLVGVITLKDMLSLLSLKVEMEE
jgi:Zn-dependent protease/CBS domain-containing protein